MQLHHHADEIEAAGAELIVIGNGTPNFIEGFRDKTGYTGRVYTDPSREVYRALELRRSVLSNLDPRAIGGAVRALRNGFRQTHIQGDPLQQGGVFAVTKGGDLIFAHRSAHPADHPAIDEILSRLRSAAPEA